MTTSEGLDLGRASSDTFRGFSFGKMISQVFLRLQSIAPVPPPRFGGMKTAGLPLAPFAGTAVSSSLTFQFLQTVVLSNCLAES